MKWPFILGAVLAAFALGLANTGCKKKSTDAPAPDQSPGSNPDRPSPTPRRPSGPGGDSPVNPQPRESRKADFKLDLSGFASKLPSKQAPNPAWEAKRGKVAEVEGVIATPSLRASKQDGITVRATGGSTGETGSIYCVLRDRADWRELTPGRPVRVVGVLDQAKLFGSASYQLTDSTVLSLAGRSDSPELTADQIFAEYAAKSPAFQELAKDARKYYLVTGKVTTASHFGGVLSDGTKAYKFIFKSPKTPSDLTVNIHNSGGVEADMPKRGDAVVILAHFERGAAEFPPTGLWMSGVYVGKAR